MADKKIPWSVKIKRTAGQLLASDIIMTAREKASNAGVRLDEFVSYVWSNISGADVKTKYESNADTNAFTDNEKTKLGNIETGATTDQTGAEIKVLYEAEVDTNAFSDADKSKLDAIEANAKDDQTGAEIKALYEAEANTNAFTNSEQSKLTGIEIGATADMTGAEIKVAYEAEADTNAFTDAEKSKLTGIESNATADQTGSEIKSLYEAELDTNAFTDAEKSKLLGIESGATADQTDAEIKTAYENNANTNAFTDAEQSKLTGIEDGADVTDSINVDAAGAVMNTDTSTASMSFVIDEDNMVSNSDTRIPTQQSVKAYVDTQVIAEKSYQGGYDASTDTPSLDDGTPIAGILKGDVYDVTVAGNFFTEAVEVGDTLRANQDSPTLLSHWVIVQSNLTPASIKTQYESNADTNAFTDADESKLDGIESGATADQTGAEIKSLYEAELDTNAFTDADHSKLDGIESGATADQTGAEIKIAYEGEANTNAFTDAEQSKLTGIEAGATADQSDAEIETAYNNQVSVVSQVEAEAGVSTTVRRWTAERVKQAIDALAGVGGSQESSLLAFEYDNTVTKADPLAGKFRLNNATPSSATEIYIDDTDKAGIDCGEIYKYLQQGTMLRFGGNTTANRGSYFEVQGVVVDETGYWTIPVVHRGDATSGAVVNAETHTLQMVGGSGEVLLMDVDASSDATISYTEMSTDFRKYIFRLADVHSSNNIVELRARLSDNGGSSYRTTDYGYTIHENNSGTINNAHTRTGTYFPLVDRLGNATHENVSGEIVLYDPVVAEVDFKMVEWRFSAIDLDMYTCRGFGTQFFSAGSQEGLQLYFSSGNIASGKIQVYGVR